MTVIRLGTNLFCRNPQNVHSPREKRGRIVPGVILRSRSSKGSNDPVVRGLRDKVLCITTR